MVNTSRLFFPFLCVLACLTLAWAQPELVPMERDVTQGALRVAQPDGGIVECPLKHTDVQASIAGFIARVKVTQTFVNPSDEPIEAVYVFPLSHNGAVDDMTMIIGGRRIVGVIKRRADARAMYEAALRQGYTAGLLEQERPNIFTQSVGNIKPRQEVKIEISYLDVLEYDMGIYEFHFPMVVGPRYNAGAPFAGTPPPAADGLGANGAMPAEGVNPPVLKPGFRGGHDISLALTMEAGVPVRHLKIINHQAAVQRNGATGAQVKLDPADSVPNKDFVLRYAVAGEKPAMALLPYAESGSGGYFMLMIQPSIEKELEQAPPRELVFLIDTSGSMTGAPTALVKRTLQEFFERSKPEDTLQIVRFSSRADKLFEQPVPATPENINKAMQFNTGYQPGGGTEMLKGIQLVLDELPDPERVRIVVLLSDGYIGNEAQIIEAVGKHAGDRLRFWALGIGSSVNRFLIDGVAKQGGGMGKVLDLNTDPSELVGEIVSRIHRAQLANISIDWNGLDVCDTFPRRIPELWVGRPVVVYGRYYAGGQSTITVSGTAEGQPVSFMLDVNLPQQAQPEHAVLNKIWARRKIEDLSAQMFYGNDAAIIEEITNLALEYRLMSQYTSFVAIDESEPIDAPARLPRRVGVPVPLPEGVSFEGIFGAVEGAEAKDKFARTRTMPLLIMGGLAALAPAATPGPQGPAGPQGAPGSGGLAGPTATYPAQGGAGAIINGVAPPAWAATAVPQHSMNARLSYTPTSKLPAFRAGVTGGTRFGMRGSDINIDGAFTPNLAGHQTLRITAGRELEYFDAGDITGVTQVIGADTAERQKDAQAAYTLAQQSAEKKDWPAAIAQAQYNYLLGASYGDSGQAARALSVLQGARQQQQEAWSEDMPALQKKLALVLRDRSIPEALAAIGAAAGVQITLMEGSLADAAALAGGLEPRVTYLDLRGATLLQALEWILTPAHLDFRAAPPDRITVSSARRLGASAWVYDVADLALPLDRPEKPEEQAAQLQKELERFLTTVQGEMGEGAKAAWYAPGFLLIFGDEKIHARAAGIFDTLRAPQARNASLKLAELYPATLKRWTARAELREKRLAIGRQVQALEAMATFSWPLFSAALGGQVDDEALAELRIAWRSERRQAIRDTSMDELLQGPDAWLAERSAWAIARAAGLISDNEELKQLSRDALYSIDSQYNVLLKAAKDNPTDARSRLGLLYTALASRYIPLTRASNARMHEDEAVALLTAGEAQDPYLATLQRIATVLLAPSPEADRALFRDIAEKKIAGDDALLLAAVAARERKGELLAAFRRALPDLTKGQPLDGSTVVLLNRLLER
jgi:Ca-activated chloride channel family protein